MRTVPTDAPFRWMNPPRCVSPVVLAVPHAGQIVPEQDLARARVPIERLLQLADPHVDLLAHAAAQAGHDVLVAQLSRAHLDLNRGPADVDRTVVVGGPARALCPRVRAGLGIVPTRFGERELLWRQPLTRAELARRIENYHRAWHEVLDAALQERRHRFGAAVLIDLHSCPAREGVADVIVGDRFGEAADPAISALVAATVRGIGFEVARNRPYAGAYTLSRHGRPNAGRSAVQVEVRRDHYLTPDGMPVSAGVERVGAMVCGIANAITNALCGRALEAAE